MIEGEEAARAYVAERCDEAAMERLSVLVRELARENEQQNLVAKNSLEVVWQRHIADSAQLLRFVDGEWGEWLDLGSGAGFPGLVVAAMRPQRAVILVESRRRRIDWLTQVSERLALPSVRIAGVRLEQLEAFPAGVISARAFAPLDRLVGLSARFSTDGTRWVLPKGRSAAQEVASLPRRLRTMFHVEQSLTSPEAGIVVGQGKG